MVNKITFVGFRGAIAPLDTPRLAQIIREKQRPCITLIVLKYAFTRYLVHRNLPLACVDL